MARDTTELRLLLVNPEQTVRRVILGVLQQAGYTDVIEVSDAKTALDIINRQPIDFIISGTDLVQLDAWRLVRLIRSGVLPVQADLPFIIVSSTYSERIAEVTAKEFEVNYFIPFSGCDQLPAMVKAVAAQGVLFKDSVLVVEDSPDISALAARILDKRFSVEIASDGESGLEAWRQGRHTLVLLDVMLPSMSGEEVLKRILEINPRQSVVMMTAHGTVERACSLLLAGAADFIAKPFRAEQLRKVCEIASRRGDFIESNVQFAHHQEELFKEKERLQVTLGSIGEGVITTDAKGRVEYLNPVAERLIGWEKSEVITKSLDQFIQTSNEISGRPEYSPVDRCLKEQRIIRTTHAVVLRNRDGSELKVEMSAAPIQDRKGRVIGAIMVFRDVTEQRLMEQRLSYQATHDALTGLTNRHEFEQRLERALARSAESGMEYVLCYIDLDQFKVINDTSGHRSGDKLLKAVAELLLQKIRRYRDTVARLGGDEFVVLLEDCSVDKAAEIASNMCRSIQEFRFSVDDKVFSLGASVGVVPVVPETHTVENVLGMADAACYMAKEKGRNRIHVYHADDEEMVKRQGEMHIVSEINDAFEKGLFEIFYQSIESAVGEQIGKHYEILIRMRDVDGKLLSPAFFLGAAERYNLAPKIDRWVIQTMFSWLSQHPEELDQLSCCAINLSGLSFSDNAFFSFIEQQLITYKIPPEKICFEVTETAAITNLHQASSFISAIRDLGCLFALDDFGSGMSSFAYLKNLPVDYLKIDGMFVRDVINDRIDYAMVRSINEVGHVLGLKTIAECVEDEEILNKLREIGVDYVQGYYFSKPRPLSDMCG